MQQMIFIADLIACSTCFGHHYAHHQELKSIIQVLAACDIWYFGFQVVGMVWSWGLCVRFAGCSAAPHYTDTVKTKAPNITGSNHLYNTLELLMMGIVVPETCWTSNKNHLLHLVGILFPHLKIWFIEWNLRSSVLWAIFNTHTHTHTHTHTFFGHLNSGGLIVLSYNINCLFKRTAGKKYDSDWNYRF